MKHWGWGDGGFLRAGGTLDFAGGIVAHINAGVAALVAALMLGRRLGYPGNLAPPHNLPFAVLGAGAVAGGAFVATHLAGSAAGLARALVEWMHNGRPSVLGIITGSVAGLAAVTPASGFVKPTGAIWIGIGGIWGVLATGLFAPKAVNPAGADGLFYGGSALLGAQVKGTLVTAVWSLVGTYAILKVLDLLAGLRVSEHEERIGLDLTGHRESAYALLD